MVSCTGRLGDTVVQPAGATCLCCRDRARQWPALVLTDSLVTTSQLKYVPTNVIVPLRIPLVAVLPLVASIAGAVSRD